METVNYNRGDEETVDDTEHLMTGPYEVELQTVENSIMSVFLKFSHLTAWPYLVKKKKEKIALI